LHPETKNPTVIGDLTNRVPFFPAPDELVAPESCDATERASARVARYAYAGAAGIVVALPIAGVWWLAFFALRWVVRGFKSAA
jgi:hypothetical protein